MLSGRCGGICGCVSDRFFYMNLSLNRAEAFAQTSTLALSVLCQHWGRKLILLCNKLKSKDCHYIFFHRFSFSGVCFMCQWSLTCHPTAISFQAACKLSWDWNVLQRLIWTYTYRKWRINPQSRIIKKENGIW